MQPFESPSTWRGRELDARDDWRHRLGPAEIDEITAAQKLEDMLKAA